MDYFYAAPQNIRGGTFLIDGDEFAHLIHVMRKKAGDEIRIVDGLGNAFDARIDEVKKRTARGEVLRSYKGHNEAALEVTIAAGVLKNPSKFDFLVEKVTELGVYGIIPLLTERTIPSHDKAGRWQKLALAAMKQSGRSFLPRVHALTALSDLLTLRKDPSQRFDLKLIAHEKAGSSAGPFPAVTASRSVLVLVGPEGGFTDEEAGACVAAGFRPVYLGDRRLRTETAAIAVATLLLVGG